MNPVECRHYDFQSRVVRIPHHGSSLRGMARRASERDQEGIEGAAREDGAPQMNQWEIAGLFIILIVIAAGVATGVNNLDVIARELRRIREKMDQK